MRNKRKLSIGLVFSGLVILGYYWKALGDRGLAADANGTAGYTTGLEMALIALGLLLFITGSSLLVASYRSKSKVSKKGSLPYLTSGLFFAAGVMFLGIPGAAKYIATPVFLIVAGINLVAARKST